MESQEIGLDDVRLAVKQGMAICEIMTNVSDEAEFAPATMSNIGMQLYDKLKCVQEYLKI